MALVDLDSWMTEYESCNRLNHTICTKLQQRQNCFKLSDEFKQLSINIENALKQYNNELNQLTLKLNETIKQQNIPLEEIDKRQEQLHSLQRQYQQLLKLYNSNNEGQIIPEDGPIDLISNNTTSVNVLSLHQKTLLEQQNKSLEELSQTMSRQKSLAARMGQEIEDQNEVLDNLANTMERVETGVHHETRNIGLINHHHTSTWRYWLIIMALFIAIVIVALL